MSIRSAGLTAVRSVTILLAAASTAVAQDTAASRRWEFNFTSGAFVATGGQRTVVKDAQVSGAQLSWLVQPHVALVGSFSWARSRDLGTTGTPKLDVFTSDLGAEFRSAALFARHTVTFVPFAGLGAGARSYNYRTLNVDATNNLAAYGAVGGELGIGRVSVRLELRDYASGFKPLAGGGKSVARNDVVITAALRFNRSSARN